MQENYLDNVRIARTRNVKNNAEREPITIADVVDEVRNGLCFGESYAEAILNCRRLYNGGNIAEYKEEKGKLPAYYFACLGEGRNMSIVHSATGLAIFDIDHFGTAENPMNIDDARKLLEEDKYSAIVFTSPSGQGLKVVVRIPIINAPTDEAIQKLIDGGYRAQRGHNIKDDARKKLLDDEYKLYYLSLASHYASMGLTTDKATTNINRACYCSYDEQIYYNANSLIWNDKDIKVTSASLPSRPLPPSPRTASVPTTTTNGNTYYYNTDNFDEFVSEMGSQGIHICDHYAEWLKVGFALHKEFGDAKGFGYFDWISQMNDGYNASECSRQWQKCSSADDGSTPIDYVFKLAKDNGLQLPISVQKKITNRFVSQSQKAPKTAENEPNPKVLPTAETTAKPKRGTPPPPPQELSPEAMQQWDIKNPILCAKLYINSCIDIRYNEITQNFDFREKGSEKWERVTDNYVSSIWAEMRTKYNIKISRNETNSLFQSYAREHTYNPIKDYIGSLPEWNGKESAIEDYFSMLGVTPEQMKLCKKWFCQLVAVVMFDDFTPQMCLVLQGGQAYGKTNFLKQLIPEQLRDDYFQDNLVFSHDKDRIEGLLKYWLIQFDEFEKITRSPEQNSAFKNYVTASSHQDFRAVKQTYHIQGKRYAIQCATTNESNIYCDSENRRLPTIELKQRMNVPKIKSTDVTLMYAEAKALLLANPDYCYTNAEEERYITATAKAMRTQSEEEHYFSEYFNVVCDNDCDDTSRFVLSAKQIFGIIDKLEADNNNGKHIVNTIKVGALGRLLSKIAEKHSTGRANVTYYVVYAHSPFVKTIITECLYMHNQTFVNENCKNKNYYYHRDEIDYCDYLAEKNKMPDDKIAPKLPLYDDSPTTTTITTTTATTTNDDEEFNPEFVKRQIQMMGGQK